MFFAVPSSDFKFKQSQQKKFPSTFFHTKQSFVGDSISRFIAFTSPSLTLQICHFYLDFLISLLFL